MTESRDGVNGDDHRLAESEASTMRGGVLKHGLCDIVHCHSPFGQDLDEVDIQWRCVKHLDVPIEVSAVEAVDHRGFLWGFEGRD